MSALLFEASVGTFRQILPALDKVIDKAAAHCAARKIDPAVLVNARLYPDMLAFARQVQLTCDFASRASFRLAGLEPPAFADVETSFDELKDRIARALAAIASVDRAAIEAGETRAITFRTGPDSNTTLPGAGYLLRFALPNFYFHATTAFDILRENGVEIGKRDYIGEMTAA
jgi:uncharacterized protein